jgi:hypothetical protein
MTKGPIPPTGIPRYYHQLVTILTIFWRDLINEIYSKLVIRLPIDLKGALSIEYVDDDGQCIHWCVGLGNSCGGWPVLDFAFAEFELHRFLEYDKIYLGQYKHYFFLAKIY